MTPLSAVSFVRLTVAVILSVKLQAYYEPFCAVLGFHTGAQDAAGRLCC